MNWGNTKGEAQSNKVTYMKMEAQNRIRVVGDIVRKYEYWIRNDKGNSLPFENLDFDRDLEQFVQGNRNPVKELGLPNYLYKGGVETDNEGNVVPAKSKKAYVCPVINRATNQVEYMPLKQGVFDGIKEVMTKLNDPKQMKKFADADYRVKNPMYVDIIFTKSGKGLDTTYKVDILDVMDLVFDEDEYKAMLAQHELDKAMIEDMKSPHEVFARKTPDELMDALQKHLAAGQEEDEEQQASSQPNSAEQEAMNELD